jgi:hypothetical protein
LFADSRRIAVGLPAISRASEPRGESWLRGTRDQTHGHGPERQMGPAMENPPPGEHRLSRRVRREQRTMRVMIRMYCVAHHQGLPVTSETEPPSRSRARNGLCHECAALLDYSSRRIESCRYGDGKPTCAQCPVHCFRPETRDHVRAVMRYSGPRMTLRHPYLAVRHLLDARRGRGRS